MIVDGFIFLKRESHDILKQINEMKNDMISYVESVLKVSCSSGHPRKAKIGYNRFEHTMRVYKWMLVLYEAFPDKKLVDFSSLAISVLFHDIGYCDEIHQREHANISAQYCREYLEKISYPEEKIQFICDLISKHSDKKLLYEEIPKELILLMEADLLDDTGAQSLVMDVWIDAVGEQISTFQSILKQMRYITQKKMKNNPMRTEKGKEIWEEKRKLTDIFIESYQNDILF